MTQPNSKSTVRGGQPFIVKNPSKYMTLTYVGSLLVIAALSFGAHTLLDRVIDQGNQTGKIVNVSGQQRMLSQRSSMFAIEYLSGGSVEAKEIAAASIKKMLENHEFLLSFHDQRDQEMSESVAAMYYEAPFNIDAKVRTFTEEIHDLLNREPSDGAREYKPNILNFAELAKSDLLFSLDAVVQQYEKESLERVNDLQLVQKVVLWVIMITIFVEAVFIFRPMVAKISLLARRLQREANFDPLTNIFNRRAFDLLASRAFKSANRHQEKLSLIVADIDLFKRVNDEFGHSAGDEVIALAAQTLKDNCRETDIVARVGGEEFSIILPSTSLADAEMVAEKLRVAFQSASSLRENAPVPLTMSFGVSHIDKDDSAIENILARADQGLYAAKNAGRNCVKVVDSEPQKGLSSLANSGADAGDSLNTDCFA
jgi:diguanylate cyclase (GGDEF)-like protein